MRYGKVIKLNCLMIALVHKPQQSGSTGKKLMSTVPSIYRLLLQYYYKTADMCTSMNLVGSHAAEIFLEMQDCILTIYMHSAY